MRKKKEAPVPPPAPARPHIKILPIAAEDLRNPERFAQWVVSHGPLVLQELFVNLVEASPNERVKILADLYKTTLNYRPFIPIAPTDNDPSSALAALLAQPMPEEVEND